MERRCDRLCSYSLRALVLACRGRGASPRYPDARLPGGSAGADEKPLTRGLRLAIASATRGFGGQATAMPARRGEIGRERLEHLAVSALTMKGARDVAYTSLFFRTAVGNPRHAVHVLLTKFHRDGWSPLKRQQERSCPSVRQLASHLHQQQRG